MSTSSAANPEFRRALYIATIILAGICVLFVGLNASSGPRLRRVDVDRPAVIRQPNQRLTLYANRPLADIRQDQVTVEPKASFSVASNGEAITLQFGQRLRYDTDYHVTVRDVKSPGNNKTAIFRQAFKTSDQTVYFLKRHRGTDPNDVSGIDSKIADEIIQTDLGSKETKTVYSAPTIQEFAVSGNKLIVATIHDDKTNSVFLVDMSTLRSEEIILPSEGSVAKLRTSVDGRLAGLTFTSQMANGKYDYLSVLFKVDLRFGAKLHPVTGINRKPLEVNDWLFAPDGTTIAAHTYDNTALLVDTRGKYIPRPLGQSFGIGNFSSDGSQVVLDATGGPVRRNLTSDAAAVTLFKITEQAADYPLEVVLLSNGDDSITLLQTYDEQASRSSYSLWQNKAGRGRFLYSADGKTEIVNGFKVLPNDQYVAAEVSDGDDDAQYDKYPINNKPVSVRTKIIDADTGKVVRQLDGFDIAW